MSSTDNSQPPLTESTTPPAPKERKENVLVSLLLNILIPSLILFKLSAESRLGPLLALIVALLFPFIYGATDLFQRRKINYISLLGLVSLLLTGVIGLFELDGYYLAVKEAAVPLVIGLAGVISIKTQRPLVRMLVYNEKVIKVDKVNLALNAQGKKACFDRLLTHSTLMISASFFLSAVLNYVLARVIVVSAAGTEQFNAELGRMMMLSYPVIVIPSMIVMILTLWYLLAGIKRLTQLDLEEIFQIK